MRCWICFRVPSGVLALTELEFVSHGGYTQSGLPEANRENCVLINTSKPCHSETSSDLGSGSSICKIDTWHILLWVRLKFHNKPSFSRSVWLFRSFDFVVVGATTFKQLLHFTSIMQPLFPHNMTSDTPPHFNPWNPWMVWPRMAIRHASNGHQHQSSMDLIMARRCPGEDILWHWIQEFSPKI